MGHCGCGGVAASMVGHTTLPSRPSSPFSSPHPSSSTSSSASSSSEERPEAPEETPADLAVQRWILSIHKIYETSGRPEIREPVSVCSGSSLLPLPLPLSLPLPLPPPPPVSPPVHLHLHLPLRRNGLGSA
ncbi:hypothetical protein DFP72DRAFT_153915 [Ephemerocybe angulata]|uniref:Uncharacterized protein n=1 Tax=Ephemerocybe angulata TaxID=980116 RepID=A0A8H6HBV6_9AGAR|nr:hypothetical protein DFP72DRAFT_153915 [Tulosesus angulatus]